MENEKKSKEVLTQVTSLAKEEEKTGVKVEIPSEDKLVQQASAAFIKCKVQFANLFPKLSSKGKIRVCGAILDLPVDSIPVFLKKTDEIEAFRIGQEMLASRFIIMQFYIKQEILKKRQEELVKSKESVKVE